MSFIRDAELENTIRTLATPVFKVAGLDPNAVHIYIVLDPTINSFVAGGQNLFINTGLLLRVQNASQLIGVMAHETGHIADGHLIRMSGELDNLTMETIGSLLLGAAVGVATGRPDAATAVAMGGQQVAERGILGYSRTKEASADQAALKFLDASHQSARGMLQFMEILENEQLMVSAHPDPYLQTHPLTQERVRMVRNWVAHSKWSNAEVPAQSVEMFKRMQAKLFAFLEPPARTFERYKTTDDSIPARYARAIAAYRIPDMPRALRLIDGLIAQRPRDPYFYEMKGQMLFENARGGEALAPYRQAVRLLPDNMLMRMELAHVEIEQDDPSLLGDAQTNLKMVVNAEPDNPQAWHLLGIAYGKQDQDGLASYALAEEAVLTHHMGQAAYLVDKAERLLPRGSPAWLRLQDVRSAIHQGGDR
jgi:predicted Zn-dependent protease